MSYETIREYYRLGLFKKSNLTLFVAIGWISRSQMNDIINGK